MVPAFHILGSDDTALFKLGVFVIVLIIWGVSALASSVKNATRQSAKRLPPLAPAPAKPRARMPMAPPALPTAISRQPSLPPLSARSSKPAVERPQSRAIPVTQAPRVP